MFARNKVPRVWCGIPLDLYRSRLFFPSHAKLRQNSGKVRRTSNSGSDGGGTNSVAECALARLVACYDVRM